MIGGNIHATNIVAGAAREPTVGLARLTTFDRNNCGGNDPKLVSRIASVIIKGSVEPAAETTASLLSTSSQ
jgi:hypothetical protein